MDDDRLIATAKVICHRTVVHEPAREGARPCRYCIATALIVANAALGKGTHGLDRDQVEDLWRKSRTRKRQSSG